MPVSLNYFINPQSYDRHDKQEVETMNQTIKTSQSKIEDELNISIGASEIKSTILQKESSILENTRKGVNQKIVELQELSKTNKRLSNMSNYDTQNFNDGASLTKQHVSMPNAILTEQRHHRSNSSMHNYNKNGNQSVN